MKKLLTLFFFISSLAQAQDYIGAGKKELVEYLKKNNVKYTITSDTCKDQHLDIENAKYYFFKDVVAYYTIEMDYKLLDALKQGYKNANYEKVDEDGYKWRHDEKAGLYELQILKKKELNGFLVVYTRK